jgi:RNase P subunit RPR2
LKSSINLNSHLCTTTVHQNNHHFHNIFKTIIPLNKILIEISPEFKVEVLISMYEPLKTETCKKCKNVIAQPKELIRIRKEGISHE